MSQSSSSLPVPAGDLWAQFSADPRQRPGLRASDADRDLATRALNVAFGEGRLDAVEHGDRLQRALESRTLGELVPLLEDIAVAAGRSAATAQQRQVLVRKVSNGAVRTWLGLAVLVNAIWVATWLFSANMPSYYWPVWPMIGTGVPVLMAWIAAGRGDASGPDDRTLGR